MVASTSFQTVDSLVASVNLDLLSDADTTNDGLVAEQLEAVLVQQLQVLAADPAFGAKLAAIFGEGVDYSGLQSAWASGSGEFLPQFAIAEAGDLNGASVRFDAATNTLFLSREFLLQNSSDFLKVFQTVLAEVGLSINGGLSDGLVAGDEGALFADLVLGLGSADATADASVSLESLIERVQGTLQAFAGSPDFEVKMAEVFGAGNDYSQLEADWLAGVFNGFPQVEVVAGTVLQGANAAYAGETNTIYVSADFLGRNAENSEAVQAVLLEEFGHSVDYQVNEVDTAGDEGEFFSNLARGIELNSSQVQQIKQDNDSAVINLDGNLVNLEESSDRPQFNFDNVYNQLISDNPKTRTIFINGVLVGPSTFEDQKNSVDSSLHLDSSTIGHEDSVIFTPYHNTSTIGAYLEYVTSAASLNIEKAASMAFNLISEVVKQTIYNTQELFEQVIDGDVWGVITNPVYQTAVITAAFPPATATQIALRLMGYVFGLDVGEVLKQYWSDSTDPSEYINDQWTQSASDWLNVSYADGQKNSLLLLGHSQGNFFLEDGLKDMGKNTTSENIRILTMGSPTNYSIVGGINDKSNITNPDDPITYLQKGRDQYYSYASPNVNNLVDVLLTLGLASGGQSLLFLKQPLKSVLIDALESNSKIYNFVAGIAGSIYHPDKLFSSTDGHGLDGYLNQARDDFKDYVQQLLPTSYYFAQGKVLQPGEQTDDDDWIEGTESGDFVSGLTRNDVLRGKGGNDTLVGGQGYDLLDGGSDIDIADYSSSPDRIIVRATQYVGSDV